MIAAIESTCEAPRISMTLRRKPAPPSGTDVFGALRSIVGAASGGRVCGEIVDAFDARRLLEVLESLPADRRESLALMDAKRAYLTLKLLASKITGARL